MKRLDPFAFRMLVTLVAFLLALGVLILLPGCIQSKRDAEGHVHTRVARHEEPTAAGGKLVLEETWTDTSEQATTTQGFDPALAQGLKDGVGAVIAAARGDYSGAIELGAGAVTTLVAAWAGSQRARAAAAEKRADDHKADAAEGWAKFADAMDQLAAKPPTAGGAGAA